MRTPARPTPLALAIALTLPLTVPFKALGAPALEDEIVVTAARMQSPLEVVTDPRLREGGEPRARAEEHPEHAEGPIGQGELALGARPK